MNQACETCEHRRVELAFCGLARAPLPSRHWCCHYNARPASGWQSVTPAQARGHLRYDLRRGAGGLEFIFRLYGAEYRRVGGVDHVRLESLAVPLVYGVPVEHWLSVEAEGKATVQADLDLANLEWL